MTLGMPGTVFLALCELPIMRVGETRPSMWRACWNMQCGQHVWLHALQCSIYRGWGVMWLTPSPHHLCLLARWWSISLRTSSSFLPETGNDRCTSSSCSSLFGLPFSSSCVYVARG